MLCFLSFVVILMKMELETFKITVLPLREKLVSISRRITEDGVDAEDIVQESLLKLWLMRGELDRYASVEAFATQMVKNLSIDHLRAKHPEGPPLDDLSLGSGDRSPDEQLEEKDAVACVRSLINKLPSLQQTIIRMKDIEGYELQEIADITGTQVEAVRVNLSRARKRIREQFIQLNKQ
jgi:RNA polymerase sigma-70 factor (ECF subfamily)